MYNPADGIVHFLLVALYIHVRHSVLLAVTESRVNDRIGNVNVRRNCSPRVPRPVSGEFGKERLSVFALDGAERGVSFCDKRFSFIAVR